MAEWQDCRILVTEAGFWTRSRNMRGFMPFSAIRSATLGHGLLSLWPLAGAPISLPLRLLTPEQQARLIALAGKAGEEAVPSTPS